MSDLIPDTFSPSHFRTNRNPLSFAERTAYDALTCRDAALDEVLLDEAFDLATRDLDDYPHELRRLRRAWRHLGSVRHGVPSLILADDLWFAAQVLVRVLEINLGLDELEMVALFDVVGLPTDAVPHFAALAELRTPHGTALGALASDLAATHTGPDDWPRCEPPDFDDDLAFDDDLDHDDLDHDA